MKEYKVNIVVSVISCPQQIKGEANKDMVNFLQASNADSGEKYDVPFSITAKRADAFSLRQIIVKDDKGNATFGKIELNTAENRPLIVSAFVKDVTENDTYIDSTGKEQNYRCATTIIERIETVYQFDEYTALNRKANQSTDKAEQMCKRIFGANWNLATATDTEFARYIALVETFGKM